MPDILQLLLIWVGNGITTALIIILNDKVFKKPTEKMLDKIYKVVISNKPISKDKVLSNDPG